MNTITKFVAVCITSAFAATAAFGIEVVHRNDFSDITKVIEIEKKCTLIGKTKVRTRYSQNWSKSRLMKKIKKNAAEVKGNVVIIDKVDWNNHSKKGRKYRAEARNFNCDQGILAGL